MIANAARLVFALTHSIGPLANTPHGVRRRPSSIVASAGFPRIAVARGAREDLLKRPSRWRRFG